MSVSMTYDDSQLDKLFAAMEPKQRASALRGAVGKAGRKVRNAAVQNLRASIKDHKANKILEKGIRMVRYKRAIGFRVTVGTGRSKGQGFYQSKRFTGSKSREVPVLVWLENGTALRRNSRRKGWGGWGAGAKGNRGRIIAHRYMYTTRQQQASRTTAELHDAIREYVAKTAKKYGCTV